MGEGVNEISLMEGAKEGGRHYMDIFDVPATALPSIPPTTSSSVAQQHPGPTIGTEAVALITQTTPDSAPAVEQPYEFPEDPVAAIRLVVGCRQHNPAWAEVQKKLKLQQLADKVAQIPIGHTLKVKTSSGVYQVKLQAILADKDSVSVLYEDGKQSNCKYTSIVWKDDVPVVSAPKKANPQDDFIYDGARPVQRSRTTLPSIENMTSPVQALPSFPVLPYGSQYMHPSPLNSALPAQYGYPLAYTQPGSFQSYQGPGYTQGWHMGT